MKGKTIVLGVSGSVACYRACDLARDLMKMGATVRVCLTDSAQKFIQPELFEALTGQPCLIDTFEEPVRGRMAHIDWARSADLLVIAPATANMINKLANGIGDDMLTTIALAYDGPILFAPAMNPTMYANDSTRESLVKLLRKGVFIVEPTEGEVACGENGQGKLAANSTIVSVATTIVEASKSLAGKHVLITSGPTHEPIDDVRFISNRSSGKMGAALVQAAQLMGACVTVVTGPTNIPLNQNARIIRVTTAKEMHEAAVQLVGTADIVIGAAAVADYSVSNPTKGKLRRSEEAQNLELVPNPDVISDLASRANRGARVIAFAAEPNDDLAEARAKLSRKGVSAIAVNDVSNKEIGFESDQNELVFVTAQSETRSGRMSKLNCALWLFKQIQNLV